MKIPSSEIEYLQKRLAKAGYNPGEADGIFGDNTFNAVRAALEANAAKLPDGWQAWPVQRQSVAYLQQQCELNDIEIGKVDGFWGPQTAYGVESLEHLEATGAKPENWRDNEEEPVGLVVPPSANQWPRQVSAELIKFYGQPGTNQVSVALPYPHRLAWDTEKVLNKFQCHEKVHDSIQRVLKKVLEHYGPDEIRNLRLDLWGGCLNVRKMRGGSNWSMHSWGIAIDYDPEHNQLKWGKDKATLARPEYAAWWGFWEEEGWLSLGRSRNYDWMHVQAARL